jgi:hypothetical protein
VACALVFHSGAADANRYRDLLARHHVTLKFHFASAGGSAKLIADPKSDVAGAFLFAGLLNRENAPDIVSHGRIGAAPFWIFYRGPETLDRLSQLKGKLAYVTIATGDFVILAAIGVKPGDMAVSPERGSPAAGSVLICTAAAACSSGPENSPRSPIRSCRSFPNSLTPRGCTLGW